MIWSSGEGSGILRKLTSIFYYDYHFDYWLILYLYTIYYTSIFFSLTNEKIKIHIKCLLKMLISSHMLTHPPIFEKKIFGVGRDGVQSLVAFCFMREESKRVSRSGNFRFGKSKKSERARSELYDALSICRVFFV